MASSVPTALSPDNGDTITNPYDTNTTFNFYFASIPQTTKKVYTQYSHKDFPDYLANENGNTIQDNIIQYFHAIGRFIQPLLHDWCFSTGIQNYYSLLLNIGENK